MATTEETRTILAGVYFTMWREIFNGDETLKDKFWSKLSDKLSDHVTMDPSTCREEINKMLSIFTKLKAKVIRKHLDATWQHFPLFDELHELAALHDENLGN